MLSNNHINILRDKELLLRMLRLNNVKAIELADPSSSSYPLIGRKFGHQGGQDVTVVHTKEQGVEEGFDYFTKLYVIEQEYRIEVKGLSIVSVYLAMPDSVIGNEIPIRTEENGWKWEEVDVSSLPEDWTDIAIRASYITGSTHAFVKMGQLINDQPIVLDVQVLSNEVSDTIIKPDEKVMTIGADVEFMLSCDNELLPASDFFPLEGPIGCDERQIEQDSGDYALVELRPLQSDSPHGLYENIKKLLKDASKEIPFDNISFRAGSMPFFGYQCGGHIHFGMNPSVSLIRSLDYYLAIPLAMIEESNPSRRRRRTKHGGLGRFRMKPYGFEYISLSSWMMTPEITLATLCLARLLASCHKKLSTPYLYDSCFQEAYYKGNRHVLTILWEGIKKELTNLEEYHQYEKELAPFFQMIEDGSVLDGKTDLRKSWGFDAPDKQYERGLVIQVPRKTRMKHQLKEGQETYVCAGKAISKAQIRPYPFSFRNSNVIQLSPSLRKALSLPDYWIPKISSSTGALVLGPILGILAERPFERQGTYFQHLSKIAKQKQMLVYVFEPKDIMWDTQQIKGTTIDGEGIFPFPAVIYDRHFRTTLKYKREIEETRAKLQFVYNIPFLNPPTLFEITGNKWSSHELLSEKFSDYLPDTRLLNEPEDLTDMLNLHGEIFVKPLEGALSKGITRVIQLNSGIFWMNEKQRVFQPLTGVSELISSFFPLKNNKSYIVQEAIKRRQMNGNFVELRSYMQKNGKNKWVRTGMVARLTNEGVMSEDTEINKRSSVVLNKLFPETAELRAMKREIGELAKNVAELIEEEIGPFGELAVDICIDQSNSIKILEINAKPDNLFSQVRAYKLRNLAALRLLNYAASLTGYELDDSNQKGDEE
ncbi:MULTISPECIES: YheC/YheD family protein [unclassified Bacillus (in: firmicutes)]|uniref:putative amidoligase domain-containing protein n=1 Tax=unclassified Bacillus (in: firmicutes) TaxID=185979 RepID=UPI0008E8E410|nr:MULTISPECIES: YheC/YheD family protein [unclassified Bacillus (in: firmicutes)]SFA77914.1 YheC/D like ATP-grasp [Bacillus sp. UNCCL13]SFQ67799.1 YheC/D like ATP-grasp [Bacillus sp. cl95]